MAEFRLGRIKFVWKDAWTSGDTYYVDDVVRYGGKTYICVAGHVADADFYTDLDNIPTRWNQMTDGQNWRGTWATDTFYALGDIVQYGGILYICNDSHTSAATSTLGLEPDILKWDTFVEGFAWKSSWATSTRYKKNDIVKYGGYTYICNTGHTSASTASSGLEANLGSWDPFNEGLEYKGEWTDNGSSFRYKKNDIVKYGSGLWRCATNHTSTSSFATDASNWTQFVKGFEYESTWSSSTTYQPGDIVGYGGNQYVAKTNHSNSNPVTGTTDWDLFTEGLKFQNDWSASTSYKIGEVVRLSGYNFLATADVNVLTKTVTATDNATSRFTVASTAGMVVGMVIRFSGTTFGNVLSGATYYVKSLVAGGTQFTISTTSGGATFSPTTASGSMTATITAMPPNASYWTRLNSGIKWQGEWTDDTEYYTGDAVRYGSNAYICVQNHRSEGDDGSTVGAQGGGAPLSRPDVDITGTYWNVLSVGNETTVLTTVGDLVYYGGAGPTRLPVGIEGQILRVSAQEEPEWATLGVVENNYYVAPDGVDLPAPVHGRTLDKPWKTIRYACEQVERGVKNPNARRLLELNRVFIQRELTEWIQYQITNNIAPFTSAFVYEDFKCERDVGFMLDALMYDIGHGGNVKSRGVALSLTGGITEDSPGAYGPLVAEKEESVAAYTHLLSLIGDILDQQAPSTNYQVLNGDNSTTVVVQNFDSSVTAEDGAYTDIVSLVGIVTDALTAGTYTGIPARTVENVTINVKTGTYRETLPIIVPESTCILGDEVRSVNAGPAGSLIDTSDAKYSIGAVSRLGDIIGNIVTGTTVTPTVGNTTAQSQVFPFGESAESAVVSRLARTIKHSIDYRVGSTGLWTLPDPTSYDSGYNAARKLIKENKKYFQAEIVAWITANYPNLLYSRTKCKRDVGYLIDAFVYDLTYGGYTQSLNAGLAYIDGVGTTLVFDSSEKTATLAAYARLKFLIQNVALNNTIGGSQTVVPQYKDTAGSAGASTFLGTLIDIITGIITSGTTAAPSVTVTTIAGTNTFTTSANHGLQSGDTFTPATTTNGLTADQVYYIKSTPALNQFTLAATYDGTVLTTFSNGTGLTIKGYVQDRPDVSWVSGTYTADFATVSAQVPTIKTNVITYINTNYPSLVGNYNTTKCARDVGIIVDAVMYDVMFNSNVQSINAAYAYLRASASEVFDLGQKSATRGALTYVKDTILALTLNATTETRIADRMQIIDDILFGASVEGTNCASEARHVDYAVLQLELNRPFMVAEINAWIANTYKGTVTASETTTDTFTISDTSWLQRNAAVKFSGTVFGGVSAGTTYYVQNVVSSTSFTIATTRNAATPLDLSTVASGSMTVRLDYNATLCERDIDEYISAIKYDTKYTGNYKSLLSARYYANAVLGSLEEDMYYVRNACGIRNQTLQGLTGDLTPVNSYGTSRVTAGAYVSLDPGWGPDDYRTWVITRSCYVQNCTTFGNAAIGQKIDGSLHNGGNKSIVSNDFTQVISDGIGAWVTNNARAELVSVFTYYSHIGYLSENGGRIRGTNGNNSYGDWGSVAEGYDETETPGTMVVDNRSQFDATVGVVNTSGNIIQTFEFENAGSEYTEVTWQINGAGTNAAVVGNEFRDDAVFQVRMLELAAEGLNGEFGGSGYVTNQNTAQGGTTTQITIAAVDQEISTAYIGMKIYLTGGTGAGQYGIIATYNAGTKVATVNKESTGTSGWDHIIPGTTIVSPDASTTYIIEPRVSFTGPGFTASAASGLSSGTWNAAVYGDTTGVYSGLTGTYAGAGIGATWLVTRNGSKYIVTNSSAGTGYSRLETITISGSSLGGTASTNDITITITAVNSVTGAIQDFDTDGYGTGGVFVALRSGSTAGAYSANGTSWSSMTLPSGGTWTSVAHGLLDDGSSAAMISKFVAVSSGGTAAASSEDGINWTARNLVTTANWNDVAFGNGRFVAISTNSTTVRISLDGEIWDITGTLTSTGFTSITYGKGYFVAVKSGSTTVSYSTNGVTWTDSTGGLPASSAWNSVTYGNNKFVAIATNSNSGAYSLDGTTWTAMTMGSLDGSSVAGYQKVKYGQGLFMATAYVAGVDDYSYVATSEDGINWTARGIPTGPSFDGSASITGYNVLAFGNPQRSGRWMVIPKDAGTRAFSIRTGATAKARAYVSQTKIYSIKIVEPGSGYNSAPTLTITDPNNVFEAPTSVRTGKGALATPTFTNRGTGYVTATAEVLTGDGYGDFFQTGSYVAVRRISEQPVAGSNVVFSHLPDRTFKLVNVLTFTGAYPGSQRAFFQVSPQIEVSEAAPHLTGMTTRIRYSQVRLTGHDFLDIGTGGFDTSNYPNEPLIDPIPANETQEGNGGRVFYTSTDQDGNFRVGGLFNIEQSTGIATLNADAFNIAGLQELTLGNVTLGGGSATISEFSTDPFFTADSDNIVPTQRAIKAYISGQIGGGGASLNVNSVTAGSIFIGTNQITTTTGGLISWKAKVNFQGGVVGLPIAWNYFLI